MVFRHRQKEIDRWNNKGVPSNKHEIDTSPGAINYIGKDGKIMSKEELKHFLPPAPAQPEDFGLNYSKKEFEKMIRKNAYHGTLNFVAVLCMILIASDFLRGVARGLEIHTAWSIIPVVILWAILSKIFGDK